MIECVVHLEWCWYMFDQISL